MASDMQRPDVLSPPEPGLTEPQLVERAAGLCAQRRVDQAENDSRYHYSGGMHEALRGAGCHRIPRPCMFRDYELPPCACNWHEADRCMATDCIP